MRLARHFADIPHSDHPHGSVVTIGSFDGLHLGHQQLLDRVTSIAKETGGRSIVMSFEPTPKEFFQIAKPPARLMRFREKFDALAVSGIDVFYCPRFSRSMRGISALDFIRRILVQGLDARNIIVGDDFRFARKREGGLDELARISGVLGYSVEQVSSVVIDGIRVSSTAIRKACEMGDMHRARSLLGRPYQMSGKIIKGGKVGRTLGFPTANVDLRRRQSAVSGIFAVRVHGLSGAALDGVANVGTRPTFAGEKPLLEVHLFDFDENVYGRYIRVDFIAYLRPEEKFERVDDLVAQMHIDADNARTVLASEAS